MGGGVGRERREGGSGSEKEEGVGEDLPRPALHPPAPRRAEEREGAPCISMSPGSARLPPLACLVCVTQWVDTSPAPQPAFGRRDPGPPEPLLPFTTSCLTVLGDPISNLTSSRGVSPPEPYPPQPLATEKSLSSPRVPNSPALLARDDLPACGFKRGKESRTKQGKSGINCGRRRGCWAGLENQNWLDQG